MKNKLIRNILITAVITAVGSLVLFNLIGAIKPSYRTETAGIKRVSAQISAGGTVHSENEATLQFQTGGTLTYLPFQEGDQVSAGTVIAQLDTTALQAQLAQAVNSYQTSQAAFNQISENQKAGVLDNQQRVSLDTTSHNSAYADTTENQVIHDTVQNILTENQASLNSASLNVSIAQHALSLATLTSPIDGIITHEDVTQPNVNVTPLTTFRVADPNNLVFRANVLASDIDFVSLGSTATIRLSGGQKFNGTVSKIYPEKTTLSDGSQVYQVDVASDALKVAGKLGQNGSVLIQNTRGSNVTLVPTWLVLSQNSVWVLDSSNHPELRKITIGAEHGMYTEITRGLSKNDKVITDPQTLGSHFYTLL